jgi:hypothetical protein
MDAGTISKIINKLTANLCMSKPPHLEGALYNKNISKSVQVD